MSEQEVPQLISEFKFLSKQMRQNLQDLLHLKRNQIASKDNLFKELFCKQQTMLLSLRINNRQLYKGLELVRIQNASDVEKLDQIQITQKSLNYLKEKIQNDIINCQNFSPQDLSKLEICQQIIKELNSINDQSQLHEINNKILKIIEDEIFQRKQLKEQIDVLELQKFEIIQQYESKKMSLDKIPVQIKEISTLMKNLMKIFKIEMFNHPDQINLSRKLKLPMFNIWTKLINLINSSKDPNITVEILDLITDQSTDKFYQFSPYQIVLTIQNSEEKKQQFQKFINEFELDENKIMQNVFPLKFYIQYLESFNMILINLDIKNKFQSNEILGQLFDNNDRGQLIFKNASNEKERNINIKYQYYEYMQIFGGSLPNSIQNTFRYQDFIEQIRQRVYSKLILDNTLENLQKGQFKLYKEYLATKILLIQGSQISKGKKKLNYKAHLNKFEKITFEEFIKNTPTPKYVFASNQDIDIEQIDQPNTISKLVTQFREDLQINKYFLKFQVDKMSLAQKFGIEDLFVEEVSNNDYYKFEFDFEKKYKFCAFMKIYSNYPSQIPMVYITSQKNNERNKEIPEFLKDKVTNKVNLTDKQKNLLTQDKLQKVQNLVNSSQFWVPDMQQHKEFSLIYQVHLILEQVEKIID